MSCPAAEAGQASATDSDHNDHEGCPDAVLHPRNVQQAGSGSCLLNRSETGTTSNPDSTITWLDPDQRKGPGEAWRDAAERSPGVAVSHCDAEQPWK
jgi:hypothetical protein